MLLSEIETQLLSFIWNNRNRNRKITRGSMARELHKYTSVVYRVAKRLYENDLITYSKIDGQKQEILITNKGEKLITNLYKN